jgi:hypothetical protein
MCSILGSGAKWYQILSDLESPSLTNYDLDAEFNILAINETVKITVLEAWKIY